MPIKSGSMLAASQAASLTRLTLTCLVCAALAACGDRAVNLFGGLSETEANRLVAYLDSQGVKTHKLAERDGTTVTVGASQLARASRLATQAGLPRTAYKGFGAVFPKDGLISSPLEERARLTYAVSQEIEAMLVDIDGVLGARVNVVIPERRNGHNTDLPAAAVLIRHRSDLETDLLEMKVRRLVASSVPGLVEGDNRQISVTFMPVITQDRQAAMLSATSARQAGNSSASQAASMNAEAPPKDPGQALVFASVGLGVVAAIAALGWVLRAQLGPMFRSKRRPAVPVA